MELTAKTPILDFQEYNINIQAGDITDDDLKQTGYCYIKNHGIPKHQELNFRLDQCNPADLKEAFNYAPMDPGDWPTEEVPGMEKSFINLFNSFRLLCYNVLDVLALPLGLEVNLVF
ncbi:hypothetical protein LOTGIDRAFT_176679 [Lottia gigantea]|uniref:Non-haem dioxygenase N-terminal domain-containing protein n=1 Tax=Lottia gigantea TaxID=225164 RepID=V3ZUR1_LOTGI|nr:hypothetical protein LOTGIDRAFT_176679 [Lottia gigantea]ESO95228.1 hypothetical protein LOTGIDRAFT_176679 [Lottia gigantea]